MAKHHYSDVLGKIVRTAMHYIHPDLEGEVDVIPFITWEKRKVKGTISFPSAREYALYKKLGGEKPRTKVVVITLNMRNHIVPGESGLVVSPTSVLHTVDHELSHISVIPDSEGDDFKIKLVDHDIEDFLPVMRRWRGWGAFVSGAMSNLTTELLIKQLNPSEYETKAVRNYIEEATPFIKELAKETVESGIIPESELAPISAGLLPSDDDEK